MECPAIHHGEGILRVFCKDCTARYSGNNDEMRRWLSEEAVDAGR